MPVRTTRPPRLLLAALPLLAGPTVLAFFSGGYFAAAQTWAGLLAWALLALAGLLRPVVLPRGWPGRVAVLGLLGLTAWTLLSCLWAPSVGPAYHAGQLVALYLGALLAALAVLRSGAVRRALEPSVLVGITVVVGYGLSERWVPGLLHFSHSVSAEGRLEQPLTYWNAMGEMAALGVVLAVRAAADASRPGWLRATGAVMAAPLGMGLYLSFSRGALFACAAGLVTLAVAEPRLGAWRTGGVALVAAGLGAVAAAPWPAVTRLSGSLAARESAGVAVLASLVVISLVAALLHARWRAAEGADRALRLPRRAPWFAGAVVCAGLAVAIVAGAKEQATRPLSPGATRLVTLQSNRYAYWRVALHAFAEEPVRGLGAGGWAVAWLRLRPFGEYATDAHSLELQTMAELGIVGGLLLLAWLLATGAATLRALRIAPALAAGPAAAAVAYLAHSPLDWDWQMPALTLVAVLLSAQLLVLADGEREPV